MSKHTPPTSPFPALLCAVLVIASAVAATSPARAAEIALAQGTIALHEAPAGQRAPFCGELVVEARDAVDDHLIGFSHAQERDGACSYALSVPAQTAVYLHIRPALVAAARVTPDGETRVPAPVALHRPLAGRGVQLRWSVVAPSTYFFAPGEQKTVPLSY